MRDAIVDTSAQVFARQGYHATGIAELCEVNGLGKGAFYYYIGSKEELLAAIHDRVMDEVMLGADRVAAAGGSPSAQLAMLGDELLDVIHRYPDHVWVFLHEFPALTDGARRAVPRAPARVRAPGRGGPPGRHRRRASSGTSTRGSRRVAWLGMHNYTYLWLKPGGRVSARDVAQAVRRHLHPRDRHALSDVGARRGVEAEEVAERAAEHRGPLVGGDAGELAARSAPGSRGTCLRRAGSRCPTRSSTRR